MKKIAVLSLFLPLALDASAQALKPVRNKLFDWNKGPHTLVNSILQAQTHIANKSTTRTKERLISSDYSYTQFTTFEDDSLRYVYSGDNGSDFDFNRMKYDVHTTPFDYDAVHAAVSIFLPQKMNILCDTSYGLNMDTSRFKPSRNTYANYDANGNLLSYYLLNFNADTNYFQDIHYVNSYNGSGNVTKNVWFAHNGASWDTSGVRYFTYNGSGKLTQDSFYTYTGSLDTLTKKYAYAYDGSGNLTGIAEYQWISSTSSWFHDAQYDLSYYGSGQLQSMLVSEDTGTGMYMALKDSLGYTAGHSYFTYFNESEFTDTGVQNIYTVNKHINAAGVPDTVITQELIYFYTSSGIIAQLVPFQDIYYYNTHNDPVAYVDNIDFGSGYMNNSVESYYYEAPTGVKNVTVAQDIHVYPNPAKNTVYIQLDNAAVNKNITINITDMNGRQVKTERIQWQNTTEQLSIADMAPGVYLMYISGPDNAIWRVQKLIKQ